MDREHLRAAARLPWVYKLGVFVGQCAVYRCDDYPEWLFVSAMAFMGVSEKVYATVNLFPAREYFLPEERRSKTLVGFRKEHLHDLLADYLEEGGRHFVLARYTYTTAADYLEEGGRHFVLARYTYTTA